jgi:hypothetical protein
MSHKNDSSAILSAGRPKLAKAGDTKSGTAKTKLDGTLAAATRRLNELHIEIAARVRLTFDDAIEAGKILSGIRASCKHGSWLAWLDDNVQFGQKTAWRYMWCYKNRHEIQAKLGTGAYLSDAFAVLKDRPDKRKRRDKLSPVVEELEDKGIPEHITRKVFAAQNETPAAEPVPVAGAGNDHEDTVTRDEKPKGWTPSPLTEDNLTDAELAALKPLRDYLTDAQPLRVKAILRSICEGGLLGDRG